jgi:hypothetical protein
MFRNYLETEREIKTKTSYGLRNATHKYLFDNVLDVDDTIEI